MRSNLPVERLCFGNVRLMAIKERREREKEQRRMDILDAARTLLLENGLKAASINGIAKLSELSIGAIYFYFKDKEEIYAALQVEGLDILYQFAREAAAQSAGADDAVRRIALAYLRFSEEHKSYFDIMNYFLASPKTVFSPELKTQVDGHAASSIALLVDAIQKGVEEGVFQKVNPRQEALILWSGCHGAIMLKKMANTIMEEGKYGMFYDGVIERFLSGIRREDH